MTPFSIKAIDVHAHFGVHDRGACSLTTRMWSGEIDDVRRRAEAAGVCLTIVSALKAMTLYGGDVLRGNDDSRQVAERHEDLLFWAVLNPLLPATFKQVEELLGHPRCAGIKIHPVNHRYDIRDRGQAVFEFADQFGAITLTHSGCENSFPEDFIPWADRYTGVRLILGHLGNSADGNYSRQVHAISFSHVGNVYADTSSARSINSGLIEWAVERVGAGKLLFGTDSPLYCTASQKARIEYAEITEQAKQAILYDNAARLFGTPADG